MRHIPKELTVRIEMKFPQSNKLQIMSNNGGKTFYCEIKLFHLIALFMKFS